jgi:uncharacterized oligopeptide transporter (OPT) family protein
MDIEPPARGLVRERTGRALVTGCAIGAVLAAGNVYTGLKISIIDGGSITAALLSFTLFTTLTRQVGRSYTALENNITQTTAASAAVMGYVAGVGGPVPALALIGRHFPAWALGAWGVGLAVLGIFAASLLRNKLIVEERLPFPTGAATGELIGTMFAARETALRRARYLIGGALCAMLVTWLRDGRPKIIPETTLFGGAIAGISLATMTVGMSWSPLMLSTGVMMGLRAAVSMALGAAVSWLLLAPRLIAHRVVASASYGAVEQWMVWPALGLLLAGSFLPLVLDWRSVIRSFPGLGTMLGGQGRAESDPNANGDARPVRIRAPIVGAAVVLTVLIARTAFGVSAIDTIAAVLLALVLANVCSRTAGETDLAPVGQLGTLAQVLFAGAGPLVSILMGSITMGSCTQTSQTLWAFKAGQRVGGSARAQLGAQLLGAMLGAAVVVPTYFALVKVYGIGTDMMPAPSALTWKATAEAVRGGLAALPPRAAMAGSVGLCCGVVLALLGRSRLAPLMPSPAAMGIAMLMPASLSVAAVVGALVATAVGRMRVGVDESSMTSLAAGGIAGESVMGVVIAILTAIGLL